MTKEEYRELRKKIGLQAEAAKLLGVSMNTVSRRELGQMPITNEARLAITHLVLCSYPKLSIRP